MTSTAVYICDCMGMVSDYVDTGSLEEVAGSLADVTLVKRVGKLCGAADLAGLERELKDSGVQRLLFAGCSPRMSLKLPEERLVETARSAGLDPCFVEYANIREQGAWLHREDREVASAVARDLLRMAHARLGAADPSAAPVPLDLSVLVIGAGPAGLAAARDLSRAGVDAVVVEKQEYLGGKLCQIPIMFQNESWPSIC